MKSFSFAKALTLGALVCFSLPVACGDDDDGTPTPADGGGAGGEPASTGGNPTEGGAGGTPATMLPPGLSDASKTEMCGGDSCSSAAVGGVVFIDPCCAGDSCGLATGFLALVGAEFEEACQAKGQPGEVDETCPTSAASAVPFGTSMIPINGFVGCCRDNGKCGVVVDEVISPAAGKLASLGLGCVDAAPFFPNETVASCGAGGSGSGGAGGMGAGGSGGAGGAGGNQ